jgi:hypothetical protein
MRLNVETAQSPCAYLKGVRLKNPCEPAAFVRRPKKARAHTGGQAETIGDEFDTD